MFCVDDVDGVRRRHFPPIYGGKMQKWRFEDTNHFHFTMNEEGVPKIHAHVVFMFQLLLLMKICVILASLELLLRSRLIFLP